jgi:hypothetical protein
VSRESWHEAQETRLIQPQRVQPQRVQLMIAQLTRVQPQRVQNYFYNFYEYNYKVKVIHKKNKLFSLHNILCMKMLYKITKGKND